MAHSYSQKEEIKEGLKNILLVMSISHILKPEEPLLWEITWERINPSFPAVKEEIYGPQQMTPSLKQETQQQMVQTQESSIINSIHVPQSLETDNVSPQ